MNNALSCLDFTSVISCLSNVFWSVEGQSQCLCAYQWGDARKQKEHIWVGGKIYLLKIVGCPIFLVWGTLFKVIEVTFGINLFDPFSSSWPAATHTQNLPSTHNKVRPPKEILKLTKTWAYVKYFQEN